MCNQLKSCHIVLRFDCPSFSSHTLSEINKSHLNMDVLKTTFLLGFGQFSKDYVSFREATIIFFYIFFQIQGFIPHVFFFSGCFSMRPKTSAENACNLGAPTGHFMCPSSGCRECPEGLNCTGAPGLSNGAVSWLVNLTQPMVKVGPL